MQALRQSLTGSYLSPTAGLFRLFSQGGSNRDKIETALRKHLDLALFDINDESSKHFEAHDSHFKMYVVSDTFEGMTLIQRHRKVKGILKDEGLMEKVHAVSLKTDTVQECKKAFPKQAEEMLCRGGGKMDKMNKNAKVGQTTTK
jgi:BolA protein